MASVTGIIVSSILPIILIIFIGVVLNRVQDVGVDSLNKLTLTVLTPALIFHSIVLTTLGTTVLLKVTVGVLAFLLVLVVTSYVFGRATQKDELLLSAFVLIAVFGNTGGLGIPLADFAFGAVGRETAVLFAAIHGVAVFTLGLFIASHSGGDTNRSSLTRVFRYPLIYAVAIAIVVRSFGIAPAADSATMRTIGLLGESAIPMMLIILGIQLSQAQYRNAISMTATPILFRFGVSPLIGFSIAMLLDFQNTTVAQVFVLLTATPVAIAPIIFVVEFAKDTRISGVTLPEYVSANVFVTTILSILVLTVMVVVLKSGSIF